MRYSPDHVFLNSVTSAATGTYFGVGDWKTVVMRFHASGTANGTIQFQQSSAPTPPDFSAASSATNSWDYGQVIDLEDGSAIDGDTGIALTADDNRNLEFNFNNMKWVNAVITTYSAGTWYVAGYGASEISSRG